MSQADCKSQIADLISMFEKEEIGKNSRTKEQAGVEEKEDVR